MGNAAPSLLALDRLSAVFKPGQTALGHRWLLHDGDEQEVGRTRYFYEGAGKSLGRLMRATGLSTSGVMHADVLGADGEKLYRLVSKPGRQPAWTSSRRTAPRSGRRAGATCRSSCSLAAYAY